MIKAILLDIEGTTTPIDFVYKTLFPFSKERIGEFVETHLSELQNEVAQLVEESSRDESYADRVEPSEPNSITAYLKHLIDADIKSTPLKSIQGMIWKEGYEAGNLKSVVYDDVLPAFERWKSSGTKIAIFSSGSVLAQQLLFRHTDHGDLSGFISNYFDTNIGPKREPESYGKIARELGIESKEILFLSDIVEELDSARAAGMLTVLTVRPGNADTKSSDHKSINTFEELGVSELV